MTWTPTGAGSYIKFSNASDSEKANLLDSAKSGTPTFASGNVTVPVNTGAAITNMFRNTTAATFYGAGVDSIDAVDTAGIQGGDYLEFDAVNMYAEIPTINLVTGDTVAVDYNRGSGLKISLLDATTDRLTVIFDSNGAIQYPSSNFTYTVNGVTSGTVPANAVSHIVVTTTSACKWQYVIKIGTTNAIWGGGMVGNYLVTQAAGTTIYRMDNVTDNGDGTATIPNTGTNTSQGDMTIYNFVASTDIVIVPNNTFSYDLSEGSGTTLGSTPSGKNITLVNSPTWN
jgi:hypothetical protein